MSLQQPILALLSRVVPFRFLDEPTQHALVGDLEPVRFVAGTWIMQQYDPDDTDVYLLSEGTVEVVDQHTRDGRLRRISVIEAGHYFGEWEVLFCEPRVYGIRALQDCLTYRCSGTVFLRLVAQSSAFSQALGTLFRDKQDIFRAFNRFRVELLRSVENGHISIAGLLPLYRRLQPALHPYVGSKRSIDFAALDYAVRRLPENVSRTFAFLLRDELPSVYRNPSDFFLAVRTEARRRSIWEMLPGKSLVVLRNGMSDLVDFVTCLCVYATEAEKIRRRLYDANSLRILHAFRSGLAEPNAATNPSSPSIDAHQLMRELPFSAAETAALCRVWPRNTADRLYEIANHREMFSIDVRRQRNNYNSRRLELWTAQVAGLTKQITGYDPAALPQDYRVHIVSSNTHSITNCLNPWCREHQAEVLAWADSRERPAGPADAADAVGGSPRWHDQSDRMYAAMRDFFGHHPARAEESRGRALAAGMYPMPETTLTGIQVQLIDLSRFDYHLADPALGCTRFNEDWRRTLIVNIDYAFGEQAEHIMRNLLMLFGRNCAGISFLGKAGALQGRRGDVLVPTAFIEQITDLFQPVPSAGAVNQARLAALVPDRGFHCGPMLTVEGTLLQNRQMLRFYQRIWRCVGIEMEGTFYYRQVLESKQLGLIRDDIPLRFLYYVSDVPLDEGETLSRRLEPHIGIPPLYGITREILTGILGVDA